MEEAIVSDSKHISCQSSNRDHVTVIPSADHDMCEYCAQLSGWI